MIATKVAPPTAPYQPVSAPRRPEIPLRLAVGGTIALALGVGVLLGARLGHAPAPAPPQPAAATPPPAPAQVDTVLIDLELDPPYARVRIGDHEVATPELRLPRSSEPVTLLVDAPEHLPASREVTPDADQRLVIRLVSSSAPTLAPRPRQPQSPPLRGAPAPGHLGTVPINDLRDPFK
jgi:hypothetical protein